MIYPEVNFRNYIEVLTKEYRLKLLSHVSFSFYLFDGNLCLNNINFFDKFNFNLHLISFINLLLLKLFESLNDYCRLIFLFRLLLRVFIIFWNLSSLLYSFGFVSINGFFTWLIMLLKKLKFWDGSHWSALWKNNLLNWANFGWRFMNSFVILSHK